MAALRRYWLWPLLGGALLALMGAPVLAQTAAIVNGHEITETELSQRLRQQAGRQVLSNLIDLQIIQDAFVASRMVLTDDDVNAFIDENFGSVDQFNQAAQQQVVSPADYIEQVIKPQIMMQKLVTQDLSVTDQVLQDFYNQHQAQFDEPEKVTYRLIAVSSQADGDRALAALQDGTDFSWVVTQYSIDPRTRAQGGLAPETPVAALPKPLADALAGLKEGDTTGVVQVGTGLWAIFKIEKRTPAQHLTFAQAKTRVERAYRDSKITQQAMAALRDKLRKDAQVEIVDPDLQNLGEAYRRPQPPPGILPEPPPGP